MTDRNAEIAKLERRLLESAPVITVSVASGQRDVYDSIGGEESTVAECGIGRLL